MQTGKPNGEAWTQGQYDIPFAAIDFYDAVARVPVEVLVKFWGEEGEWARVIGGGREHRWPPIES